MASTRPTRASNVLTDEYLAKRAEINPVIKRFLDVYKKSSADEQMDIDAKLTQLIDELPKMGIIGAAELLMYGMEWRAAFGRPNKRRTIKHLRLGHALEQRNWPDKRQAAAIVEED